MTNTLMRSVEKSNSKGIKSNIKDKMKKENISVFKLSEETNINVCKLIFLLNFSFSKIRLSYAIKICEVLKIRVSDVFD